MDDVLRGLERELTENSSDLVLRFKTARALARAEQYNAAWTLMWDGYEFRTTEFWDKDVREFLSGVGSNLYKELEFEPRAPRARGRKVLYEADKSLERCVEKKYDGHPLPVPVFSLLIAEENGFLDEKNKKIANNMLGDIGEWFGIVEQAVEERVDEKKNKYLIYYEHPQNFTFDKAHINYDFSKMTFEKQRKFSLKGFKLDNRYSLSEVNKRNPDLVLYHWSQQFEQLPEKIKNNANLWMPADFREIWPVGRDDYDDYYDVVGGYDVRASRGVRRENFFPVEMKSK